MLKIMNPQKAVSHYNHVDSNTLSEIQEKFKKLFKLYSDKLPVATHKVKEKPKVRQLLLYLWTGWPLRV